MVFQQLGAIKVPGLNTVALIAAELFMVEYIDFFYTEDVGCVCNLIEFKRLHQLLIKGIRGRSLKIIAIFSK